MRVKKNCPLKEVQEELSKSGAFDIEKLKFIQVLDGKLVTFIHDNEFKREDDFVFAFNDESNEGENNKIIPLYMKKGRTSAFPRLLFLKENMNFGELKRKIYYFARNFFKTPFKRDNEEKGCYPNVQNFPTYIYDKDTKYFEKCYQTCKFCSKYFCGINCLMKHSSLHSSSNNSNTIGNTLKKKLLNVEKDQYPFITPGIFTENYKYSPEYDLSNFVKEYDGIVPIELGFGSFGRVYLVTHKITKKKYALKVINKRKLIQAYGNCKLIYNEIEIQSKLNHRNIIRLYTKKETDDEIQILLEYAENGNLFNLIQKENGLDESKAFLYFIQIVNAVNFLHQNNIIHRDIKPENILFGENNLLKLCDFGWAKEINVNNRITFCGTMEYMAPEIVGSENYDFSVDIWSLGILLYELIMGHSPFRSQKDRNIVTNIKKHDLVFDKNKNISKECIDLINGLLDANPNKRLKLKDIFVHPFIINNLKTEKIVKYKPRKESLDDSNENIIKFLNNKYNEEKFLTLKKKFGFDSKLNLKNKLSSRQLFTVSDNHLIRVNETKEHKDQSKQLEKLIDIMSDELEKGKKKVDDLNFKKTKQFCFEDFRDTEILNDNNTIKEELDEDSKIKETNYNTYAEKSSEDDNDEDINNNNEDY